MKNWIRWLLPGVLVLALDRVVKILTDGLHMPLIPGVIGLQSARNTGMAMGLFQGGAVGIVLISLLAAGACAFLLRGTRIGGIAPVALSLIAGGALGNLWDRVFLGAVIDMFELLFMRFYIFNVADVGVVTGAVLCAFSLLFRPQDWSKK